MQLVHPPAAPPQTRRRRASQRRAGACALASAARGRRRGAGGGGAMRGAVRKRRADSAGAAERGGAWATWRRGTPREEAARGGAACPDLDRCGRTAARDCCRRLAQHVAGAAIAEILEG